MSSNSDDIQAAGSDTRPPMLDRTDYESWSQRIRLYCRGKENGLQILQSIDQGPFELGTTRDTLGTTSEGGVLLGPERPRTYDDLNDDEKKRYDADVRATNIVLQGLPKDIYKLINHNIEAKAIWDNVKMLLAGSELTKEDRESQLYDEFERFRMLPGENINEYYVRFHKLVNDMRNIRMTMPNIQLNSKFVNNMSPEWDRFVTSVKLNKGLKETNHEQLYAYLKQHEKHAAQDRLIIERITPSTNDPLAFVSSVQPYSQPSQSQSHQYQSFTTPPQSQNVQSILYSQFAESSSLDTGYTQTEEILNTISKQFALLTQSFRATLPQTNNQLRTSSNTRNQATIQDGFGGMQNRAGNANAGQGKPIKCYNCNGIRHIARNCTQPKRPQNSDYLKDKMLLMQAQENGAVLDEEELLFLADECDAFDSDVDDEPTSQSMFMANLSSAGSASPQAGPSNASILSEVYILENAIDNSVTNLDEHEIHNEVQQANVIDSTSVDMGNSNVIPYEQYLSVDNISDFEKTCKKRITPTGITKGERGFEQTKRCYLTEVIPFFNLLKEHFDGVQKSLVTEVRAMKTVFENLEAEVDQNEIDLKSGKIEQKNLLITNENLIAECLSKDMFYTATDFVLNVSRFSDMHDAYPISQNTKFPTPLAYVRSLLWDILTSHSRTPRRVRFGWHPDTLISEEIRTAAYYSEYVAKVTKYQRYLAGEAVSDNDTPASKPAKGATTKSTRKPKPQSSKTAPVAKPAASKTSKSSASQPSKPTPAPAKPQQKKRKLVEDTTEAPSQAKRSKAGEPDTGKFQPLPEVEGKGKEKVGEEQAAQVLLNLQTPKKKNPVEQFIFQRRTPATTEPSGLVESSSLYAELGLTDSEMDSDEEVQENLKLPTKGDVRLKEPASSAGTLSSMKNLNKEFLVEKSQEDELEKTNTEVEVLSMVTVPIHQDTSSVPLITTPVIDITDPQSDSTTVPASMPTTTAMVTETTTTTTVPHDTTQLQQDISTSILTPDDWSARPEYSRSGRCKSSPGGKARTTREQDPPIRDSRLALPTLTRRRFLLQRMLEENYDKRHEDHKMAFEALQKSIISDESEQFDADKAEERTRRK
ncbi:retrovirus-related pol polyprotein from transposon TNT 1-94 [Tanacetum coccineum]